MRMNTERLRIRKFQKDDLDDLFALLSDQAVMLYLEEPYTKQKTKMFLYRFGIAEQPLIYAVENRDGAFVGYIIYHPYDKSSYEIGWVLHKNQWGKGYASELTKSLIENARAKTQNLIIECSPSQTVTRHIALKNHFSFVENRNGLEVYRLCLNDH